MKKDTIEAFSRALQAVLSESGLNDVSVGTPRSHSGSDGYEVSISVGIAGMLKGFLFLLGAKSAAQAHAVLLSEKMGVPLDEPDGFGPMHKAALAELVNQVSGRATILLSDIGIDADITPPTIVTGGGISTSFAEGFSFVDFALQSGAGEMVVAVGYQEG